VPKTLWQRQIRAQTNFHLTLPPGAVPPANPKPVPGEYAMPVLRRTKKSQRQLVTDRNISRRDFIHGISFASLGLTLPVDSFAKAEDLDEGYDLVLVGGGLPPETVRAGVSHSDSGKPFLK